MTEASLEVKSESISKTIILDLETILKFRFD